ncbi:energy transducer TonB [Lacihabitans soyangensis]|uniref:energy transducer TonB n=1 Tax=Lacihabitans soyangensis TaxID=869394 RepID=UPI0020CE9DE7|nr:energy transducer TonB [Lacihabitans soyangensis]
MSLEIDKSGNTSNYKYVKSIGYGMDEAAMRVLKEISSTNWIPAVYQGKKLKVEYHFPVVFKLD